MNEKENSTYKIKSVDKALSLLEAMAGTNEDMELTELARKTGVNTTTCYRILQTFRERGFVVQNPDTGKYRLGLKLVELGYAVTEQIELRKIASPLLQELMERTGETANLVVLDEGEAIYIEKVESPASLRMFSRIGKQAPAHATGVGKVLLAALPSEKLQEIVKHKGLPKLTEKTITSFDKLQEELERIRKDGFAIDDEECEIGAKCIAAPVRDYTREVVAAVSISGPSARLTENRLEELRKMIKETAYKISREIGYRG